MRPERQAAVSIFKTHEDAPRVLLANSHLVPAWANRDEHARLEGLGLTMFGQMTAGSWIYIGSQGIVQGTYETFAACGRTHFNGDLSRARCSYHRRPRRHGRRPAPGGHHGGRGGFLGADVDGSRIDKRIETGYLRQTHRRHRRGHRRGRGGQSQDAARRSRSASCCNIIEICSPRLIERNVHSGRTHRPDLGARSARRLRPGRPVLRRSSRRCAKRIPRATSSAA